MSKSPILKTGGYRFNSYQTRHFLFAFLFSFSTLSLADKEHWQSSDYIINSFVDIALNNEYSTKASKIRKWNKPIFYTVKHRVADESLHQQLTEGQLAHLASITGINISPATPESQTNLTIIFSTEKFLAQELKQDFLLQNDVQISELTHHGVCLAHLSVSPDSSIDKAIVIIPVDRARAHAKLLSCVVEELTQIMGLPNDSDKVFPSIFNDKSHNDFLSGLDYVLLKLLYHPSIKLGLNTTHVRKLLNDIISEEDFQQLIENSEYLVQEQSLSNFLN